MTLRNRYLELEKTYDDLPNLGCFACGQCCVEPHFSLLEFSYLIDWCLKEDGEFGVRSLMMAPYKESQWHPGDPSCPVQNDSGQCSTYRGRGLPCRMEGFPALEGALERAQPVCPNHQLVSEKDSAKSLTKEKLLLLSDRLRLLNEEFYECSTEPWFCYVLPLQAWWSVLFDTNINDKYWLGIRRHLFDCIPIEHLSSHYCDHTNLAGMISDITRYYDHIAEGKIGEARNILGYLMHGYPKCGDYFQREGAIHLDYINRGFSL